MSPAIPGRARLGHRTESATIGHMGNTAGSEKSGLFAGIVITVMAAFLAGIASDNFVSGFVITAIVCAIALIAARFLARVVIDRRNR